MEAGFIVGSIPLDLTELTGLPTRFLAVVGSIERKAVGMEMWIGHSPNRTGGKMNELRPHHVAGYAVFVFAGTAHTGSHIGLKLPHRLAHGFLKCREYPHVSGE